MADRAAVLERAISFAVRLNSGHADASEHDACRRWREADAEHERVWRQLQAIESDMRAVSGSTAASAAAASALRTAPNRGRRQALAMLALGVAGAGATLAWRDGTWERMTADYRSGVGEQRRYALAAGAELWLNTDSAVRADPGGRRLTLLAGELRMDTGPDAAWEVRTRQACFTGTRARFVLRQLGDATLLELLRGDLRIAPLHGREILADPGARYRVSDHDARREPAAAFDADGWANGVLTVRGMRLADFLAELSRYQRGWISCDPAVADLRVSGVFLLDDVPGALDTLSRALPMRIQRYTGLWTRVLPA
ncbi:FecR domain-containing protein [Achromobacter spanius]|uniref:FecR domain-containing protein n=1 Tax=Achromobacter spanius TaxID=217203 RepID=UPI003209E20D